MRNIFKIIIITALSGCIIATSSCLSTRPVCLTSSNTPLNNKKISENKGKVKGRSNMTWSILGLWMLGKPDIQTAIDDAKQQKDADALINIKCYEDDYYLIFFGLTRVTVEGEAVKFEK
ncbi:MAG: hypothetical protein JW864_18920 [Spirochaetes bacterium]|nr:hypothetical protein [Spirochaetota bacterium]